MRQRPGTRLLFLIGKTGSSLDLGTLASPGANVLQSNNTTNTAQESSVRVSLTTGDVVQAVGNTWNASAQGADAAGRYMSAGAGQTLEVTSGAGTDYNVVNTTLRLAESP